MKEKQANEKIEQKKKNKKEKKQAVKKAGQSLLTDIREALSSRKVITETNEIVKEFYVYHEKTDKKHSAYSRNEWITFASFGLILANIVMLILLYFIKFDSLKTVIFTNNGFYLVAATILPFIAWVLATNENFWAFHKRKRLFFYMCCLNLFLVLMQPVYTAAAKIAVGITGNIKTNPLLTQNMLTLLAQVIIVLLIAAVIVILYSQTEPLLTNSLLKKQIEFFKLQHVHDDRSNRDYRYDITTIKSLETGNPIRIKENDRFVQTEINGASGTGKTSSIFITTIEEDLDTKIKNQEKRQEAMLQMMLQHKATIQGPLREFEESAVIPIGKSKGALEKNRKELEKIKKKYPDCGITVVAPNNSLNEEIVRLCKARNIKVNILDPVYEYNQYKNAKTVSINPFYIPLGLEETERLIRISEASTVFSDVLIATNQMGGETDQYFTDISLAVSSNISTVVMLAKNIDGEQAYIEDIQECISNFKNLKQYVDRIEQHYDIYVSETKTAKGRGNQQISAEDLQGKETRESRSTKKNPYYPQIVFVKQELLGAGAEDMFSQARGLRNLLNKVVQDPRIKTKLTADEESMIDFDKILSNNEVTVVNTAIELGKSTSTAFGLFFILLHKVSVLRRPKDTRTPHFLWIDEAAQYMHPCYEDMISLYRQYRCAVVITLQSLSQTEKSRATAYLKDVFLGAGTHIVFGRLTPEEMKLYSEMGGIDRVIVEQKSYTSNSIFSSSPSYTESVRQTPDIANVLEGADMRIRDFQELTIFTIDNGRVLPGQLARVFFVKPDAFDNKIQKSIIWERVVPEAFKIKKKEVSEETIQEEKEIFLDDGYEGNQVIEVTTKIPESETEEILEQTNKEGNRRLEQTNFDNMSLQEMFMALSGAGDSSKDTQPDSGTQNETEETSDKETDEDEIDYEKELEKFNKKRGG